MKTKMFAAILFAAVVTALTCNLSKHQNHDANRPSLLSGRFEIVSITDSSGESAGANEALTYFFNLPLQDSSRRYLDFSSDSTIIYETSDKIDSAKYYADTSAGMVYLKNDSAYTPFSIVQSSDSIINLIAANDSVYIALKKL